MTVTTQTWPAYVAARVRDDDVYRHAAHEWGGKTLCGRSATTNLFGTLSRRPEMVWEPCAACYAKLPAPVVGTAKGWA